MSLMTGGWLRAANLREQLQARCPRLRIAVYVHYEHDRDETGLFIKARHPQTNAIRFTKLLTFEEIKDQKQYELLMSQLWLVEPPPT
jgi:hypothetical protein